MDVSIFSKMIKHLSQDGLIMYSKSCDYYKKNPITQQDIKTYYDLLMSDKMLPSYINRPAHKICCLYYLTKENQNYKNTTNQEIHSKVNGALKDVNDGNLFYLYNSIEYFEKFLNNDRNLCQALFNNFERFSTIKKTIENFLLYKYYRGILLLRLGFIDEAFTEYLELVNSLAEEVHNKTSFTEFIKLKNDLFNLKLQGNANLEEQYNILIELYEKVQQNDKLLAIKLGFGIYENLCKQNKFNECLSVLTNIDSMIKREAISGNLKNGFDYFLTISSRLGFIGILINNKKAVEDAIRTIDDTLSALEGERTNNNKINSLIKGYSLVSAILKINLSKYVDRPVDIAQSFKVELLPNNPEQLRPGNFIVNKDNYNECLISINGIINNMSIMDNNVLMNSRKLIDSCGMTISKNSKLKGNLPITFIIGVQTTICQLAETYCSENSKQNESKNNIIKYASTVLNYANNYYDVEPYFQTDFIKSTLIRIYSSYTHLFIYKKDFDKVKKSMLTFDDLSKKLKINERTPYYELVLKIKGDYWLLKDDKKASINYYEDTLRLMPENNPKKPIVYFNLGCLHYLNNNRGGAIDNLNKCINGFINLGEEKKTFNSSLQKRQSRKISIAKNLLSQLNGK